MKFGVMQSVLGQSTPGLFNVAARLKFDGVELDWNHVSDATGGHLAPANRPALRAAAADAGVDIHCVVAHFLNHGGIAAADATVRREHIQAVRVGLELCHELDATALLVPFYGPAEIVDSAGQTLPRDALDELAGDAERAKVTIAIEHSLPGPVVARIIDEVGSGHVGNYFDMANCNCFGHNPVDEVLSLGGRIVRVHAKEWSRGADPATRSPGEYPGLNRVPLGSGDVPVPAVLRALREIGYDGYITLETGVFGSAEDSAQAALLYLRQAAA